MQKEEKEPEIGLLQAAERETGVRHRRKDDDNPVDIPAASDEDTIPRLMKQADSDPPKRPSNSSTSSTPNHRPSFGSRLKSYVIGLLVIVLLLLAVLAAVFLNGLRDLRNDTRYLIVVEENNIPKAAALYQLKTRESEIFNIGVFPSPTDMERFLSLARQNDARVVDRVIVLHATALATLSRDDNITFRDYGVPVSSLREYLLDTVALPPEIKGEDDADWKTKSALLGDWVEEYHDHVWKGEDDYNQLISEYRKGAVFPYPSNGALTILQFVPLEQFI